MSWVEHIININLVFDKIIVSTQIHWNTYTAAIGTTASIWQLSGDHISFVYKYAMSWIEHIININSVLDKIIVSTQIYWDTYAVAVGTPTPPPPHLFDGSAVIICWAVV